MPCNVTGLISLLIAAFLVRLTVVLLGLGSYEQDPDSYARLACGLAQSGVFGFETAGGEFRPTAFRPPLYPWILSWLVHNGQLPTISVALLHLTLGMGTVWLTYSIAKALRLAWPCLPGIAIAIDPLLLRDSQLVMTETLAAFLVVVVWRLWLVAVAPVEVDRPSRLRHLAFVILGLALGISILARPTVAPWSVLCAAALLLVGGSSWRDRLTHSALVCFAVLACVGPWTIRNLVYFDKPIWATTHGGYTLLLANNRELYAHFRAHGPSRTWNAEPFHTRWAAKIAEQGSTGEIALDQIAYAEGMDTIREQPVMFIASSVYRVGWLWALWPNTQQISLSTILIAAWYLACYVLAIRGAVNPLVRKSMQAWIPALALLVSLTAVHSVYWSNMRMRAPMMSVIYLLAAVSPLPPASRATILSSMRKT